MRHNGDQPAGSEEAEAQRIAAAIEAFQAGEDPEGSFRVLFVDGFQNPSSIGDFHWDSQW